jgi:Protein of unknown function (DUF4038)/Putative collagen-binding domain of a collagenase
MMLAARRPVGTPRFAQRIQQLDMKRLSLGLLICVSALPLAAVTWPIGVSANGRYFQDAAGQPFFMSFDTAHAIIGEVATSGYAAYLSSRQGYKFNGVQIFGSTLRASSAGAAKDGTLPFTVGSGPSSYVFGTNGANLNNAYWSKIDSFVSQAAADGLIVALNPLPGQYYDCNNGGSSCEDSGSASSFANNGATAVYQLGAAFGTRYKNSPNLMWYLGDDCGSNTTQWCNLSLQKQFLQGILSTDPNHLAMFENNYFRSYSNQVNSSGFGSLLKSDLVYSYYETYDYASQAYGSSPTVPCFLGESNYEGGNNTGSLSSNANAWILRMQNWWTVTSGCMGTTWGNESVNHNDSGYPASLNTTATAEVVNLPNLLAQYKWWNLVPDSGHAVVTSGYGTSNPSNENLYTATYATTAWIADGSLAITYTPVAHTLTVAMSKFAGPVTPRWYDPSNGTFTAIGSSALSNSGTKTFSTPGNNHDGNSDWVLVLDATAGGTSPVTVLPPSLQVAHVQ